MELEKLVKDIFNVIIKFNKKESRDAIPHSDVFFKEVTAQFGVDEATLENIILLLRDAHKIFVFEISKEDKTRNINRIQAYVDADITTVRRLKFLFQDLLVTIYEEEFGKKVMAHQAISELFPKINIIANTPLGNIANKAIMLDEYERLLEKQYSDYTEDTKDDLLAKVLEERKGLFSDTLKQTAVPEKEETKKGPPGKRRKRRAVDSEEVGEYDRQKKDLPVAKLISIYGIDFFLRVHLRRYEFEMIKESVEKGILRRPEELKKLKDLLGKIKNNFDTDPGLSEHMTELYSLDRVVSLYMHRVIR